MKILITGGMGFIGSHLADRLLAEGHQLLVIDNYSTGRKSNLSAHPKLSSVEGNIEEEQVIQTSFRDFQPEVVVHTAASYKDPYDWAEDARTNILGTIAVVKACQAFHTKRLIYLQTSLCYGLKPLQQPIQTDHPLLHGDPFHVTSYAISKTAGEQYIQNSGLDYVSFRLANVYGPRNITGPIPAFFKKLSQGESCTVADTKRDFIYVNDVVDCIVKATLGKGEKDVYHLSTGRDHSIKELFGLIASHLGIADAKHEVKAMGEDDVPTILIDPSKTLAQFNWTAATPLSEGIRQTLDWYKSHSITHTYTHLKNIN